VEFITNVFKGNPKPYCWGSHLRTLDPKSRATGGLQGEKTKSAARTSGLQRQDEDSRGWHQARREDEVRGFGSEKKAMITRGRSKRSAPREDSEMRWSERVTKA